MKSKLTSYFRSILPWAMCLIAALFYSYEYLLRIAPSVMTKSLMNIYHINATQIGILNWFYYLAYTPMQIIVGPLVDHYGVKKLLAVAIILCGIGAYLFGMETSLLYAQIGRFLMGFGSAFAFVAVLKVAADWLPRRYFSLMTGITTMLGMLGAIGGQILITKLVSLYGSGQAMIYASFIAIILLLLDIFIIRDKPQTIQKEVESNKSRLWMLKDLYAVLKNPQIWLNGMIGCFLFMPLGIFSELWAVPYFESVCSASNFQAATMSSMIFWGWAVGSPIIGVVNQYITNRRSIIMTGTSIAMLLFIILIYLSITNFTAIYILTFIIGLSCSVEILVFPIAKDLSPLRLAATAIGVTNMIVNLNTYFTPLVGAALERSWEGYFDECGSHIFSASGYQQALIIIPVGLAMALLLCFLLKEEQSSPE